MTPTSAAPSPGTPQRNPVLSSFWFSWAENAFSLRPTKTKQSNVNVRLWRGLVMPPLTYTSADLHKEVGTSHHDENDINDLGLQADLSMWQKKPFERCRILQLGVAGIGALLTSCSNASGSGGSGVACVAEIFEETAGPYPANGSSGGPGDGDPVGTPPGGGPGGPPSGGNASPPSAVQSGDDEAGRLLSPIGEDNEAAFVSVMTGPQTYTVDLSAVADRDGAGRGVFRRGGAGHHR